MATYYLSTTGNDTTGDGSYANPWLTISKAHTSASDGDTVVYKNGTYTLSAAQTFTKTLTVSGETSGGVILDCNYSTTPKWVNTTAGKTMTYSNLVFYRWYATANAGWRFYAITQSFTGCEFRSCKTQNSSDSQGYSGFIGGNSNGMVFSLTSCLFNDFLAQDAYLIYIFGFRNISTTCTLNLTNCTFYFSTNPPAAGNRMWNVYQVTGNLITVFKNIIMYDANGSRWQIGTTGPTTLTQSVTYSDQYNLAATVSGTGNITTDPLFVDAANGNFNLRPASPCIDSGAN